MAKTLVAKERSFFERMKGASFLFGQRGLLVIILHLATTSSSSSSRAVASTFAAFSCFGGKESSSAFRCSWPALSVASSSSRTTRMNPPSSGSLPRLVWTAKSPQRQLATLNKPPFSVAMTSSSSSDLSSSRQSSSSSPTATTTLTAAMKTTTTPAPKYPTARGSPVDARQIIKSQASVQQHLTAVLMQHILLSTRAMAETLIQQGLKLASITTTTTSSSKYTHVDNTATTTLAATSWSLDQPPLSFADLARQISACSVTRDHGGMIGWVSLPRRARGGAEAGRNDLPGDGEEEEDRRLNGHLDEHFPSSVRRQVCLMTTKPGDVVLVESGLGFHVVQIVDVMVNVRRMANVRPAPQLGWHHHPPITPFEKKRAGILSGAWTFSPEYHSQSDPPTTDGDDDPPEYLTYKMETMGCQMNVADSERIEGQLQSLGLRPWQPRDDGNKKSKQKEHREPDLILLNTCSIRDHAEQKVYSYLGPYAKRKRQGDDVMIVVAGCVAQQEGEALLRRVPEIDLVMGPQYANRLADLLQEVAMGNQVVATEMTHIMEDSTKPRRESTVAAWVNVIYGCNERCTFCIVPTTRGVEQSRPVESILQEVHDLVQAGYKEITLLGQNIDAYGRDMIPKRKFSDLIRWVGSVPGLQRLRFVTSHPRYMSLGVVDAVAETPAACESFHIPFQSGSNAILSAMGRGHTREKYLHIVERIRSRLPEASITADVIVGFPGETEQDFQDTLAMMEEVVFDSVNTAAYSPRPNTPAASWANQIPEEVKEERLKRINALNKEHATLRRSRLLGQTIEVLVEERNIRLPHQVMGRTRHGYIVYCPGDIDELRGQLILVRISCTHVYHLVGDMVSPVMNGVDD